MFPVPRRNLHPPSAETPSDRAAESAEMDRRLVKLLSMLCMWNNEPVVEPVMCIIPNLPARPADTYSGITRVFLVYMVYVEYTPKILRIHVYFRCISRSRFSGTCKIGVFHE